MTIWGTSNSIRHPWFDTPTTKRKLAFDDECDESNPQTIRPRKKASDSIKRRRITSLESGFGHLSLESNHLTFSPPQIRTQTPFSRVQSDTQADFRLEVLDPPPVIQQDASLTDFSFPVMFPSSVEEPISPDSNIPEVTMKTSSWYEPEKDRIIVTSLDDSDEESDQEGDLQVSPALLNCIKEARFSPPAIKNKESMALVLFTPITFTSPPKSDMKEIKPEETAELFRTDTLDEDAMDVEP
jgi:hypothetical protein